MKKLFAIFLFSVYLFNLAGYALLMDYFIDRTDKQMVQQLDNGGYNDAGLIEIKVSLRMPYGPNQTRYERWDGEIELNGIHYNYVKRKIFNDTLSLLCLPNMNKTQMSNAKKEYAGSMNDVASPAGKKQQGPLAKKACFENEYDQHTFELMPFTAAVSMSRYYIFTADLSSRFTGSPEQPPDFSC